jgi:arabinoxylan arabinofuranohydrolase
MKKSHKFPSIWLGTALLVLTCFAAHAANPIITHIRAADPSAEVWPDGKVWIYASHDQDDATDYSSMDGYHAFSSSDMVNWTDHGEILHSRDVSWGIASGGFMWAPDAAYKDGTYYLYFPHKDAGGQWRIGVATSLRPEGPFTDVGNYIQGTSFIDPTCFIDDDGEAYLYWGHHKVAKLKSNMIELAESPRTVDYGTTGFQEGVYMHKRNGIYYFSWSRWQSPDAGGHYSTGTSPYGPFTYRGKMASGPPGAQDHHSIIEYCGQSYYFYHVGNYNGGSSFRRNTCVEYLTYNPDGTIQPIIYTTNGVGLNVCSPWPIPGVIQTEGWSAMSGVQRMNTSDTGGGLHLGSVENGDWAEYQINVAQAGDYLADLRFASGGAGGSAQVLINGAPVGSVLLPGTGGWQNWVTVSTNLPFNTNGVQTLRFNFSGGGGTLLDLNWVRVRDSSVPAAPSGLVVLDGRGPVVLDWADHGDADFSSYKVYRSAASGAGYVAIRTNLATSFFVDENFSIGQTYYYVVKAVDTSGNESPSSDEVSATPDLNLIEAEDYSNQSGVQTQPCSEGGLNLSFINDGDWAEYEVNLPVAGTYRLDLRISGYATAGRITVTSGGQTNASVLIPGTGGWQTWMTVSSNCVFTTPGLRTLRLNFGGGNFNLNWFALTALTPTGSNVPPVILAQPASLAKPVGSTAAFSVAATGTAPLNYQWFFNTTVPVGSNSPNFNLPGVALSDSGGYRVVVSNSAGAVTSVVAMLTVTNVPVSITTQPQSQNGAVGGSASFSMTATGTVPLSYQWYFNGSDPVGNNSATLQLTTVQLTNAGHYHVVVSNAANSATSAVAVLTVSTPALPGATNRIEAEDYELMSGIQLQATTDTGGGMNVAFIHAGDWTRYTNDLVLPQAGEYRVDFRVASAGAGGTIQIIAGNQPIGSVAVANTGGWQNWVTVGTNVTFPSAGPQDITLNFSGPTGFLFNLNWFEVTTTAPAPPPPTNLVWSIAGPKLLVLTWPNGAGWRLQCQTNTPARGLGSNWFYLEGVTSPYTNLIHPGEAGIFYRLVYP